MWPSLPATFYKCFESGSKGKRQLAMVGRHVGAMHAPRHAPGERMMPISAVLSQAREEFIISGLGPVEIAELREWFSYTKPVGPSMRVVAIPASGGDEGFRVVAAGSEPAAVEECRLR
jgi:hypothetical protein